MHMTPGARCSGSFCFCIGRGSHLNMVDSGAIENQPRAPYAIASK